MFSGKASPFVYVAMWAICTIHLDSGAHSRSFFVRGFVVSVVLEISGRGYFRYAKIARRPPDIYTLLHFSHQVLLVSLSSLIQLLFSEQQLVLWLMEPASQRSVYGAASLDLSSEVIWNPFYFLRFSSRVLQAPIGVDFGRRCRAGGCGCGGDGGCRRHGRVWTKRVTVAVLGDVVLHI
jgi:hypothetical protein